MEVARCGWSMIAVGIVGVMAWFVLGQLLWESMPDTHGEAVWAFLPIMNPFGALAVLPIVAGFGLLVVYMFQVAQPGIGLEKDVATGHACDKQDGYE